MINVLLPLVDMLNHNPEGAGLKIQGTAMVIKPEHPGGGGECFPNYGNRRDALDLTIHYGFADTSSPFARSAHLDLNVDGLGRLRVNRQLFGHPDHPLDPPLVNQSESELTISHFCCDRSQPLRLLAVLDLIDTAEPLLPSHPQAAILLDAAQHQASVMTGVLGT